MTSVQCVKSSRLIAGYSASMEPRRNTSVQFVAVGFSPIILVASMEPGFVSPVQRRGVGIVVVVAGASMEPGFVSPVQHITGLFSGTE